LNLTKVNYLEKWDWLIILDSARYDSFIKLWNETEVDARISLGSCTLEVLNKMPRIENSVCVTGHPFVIMHGSK